MPGHPLIAAPRPQRSYPRLKYGTTPITIDVPQAAVGFPGDELFQRASVYLMNGHAVHRESRLEERAVIEVDSWPEGYLQLRTFWDDHASYGKQFEFWRDRYEGSSWLFERSLADQNGLVMGLNNGAVTYIRTDLVQRVFHAKFDDLTDVQTNWNARAGLGTETIQTGQGEHDAGVYQADGSSWRAHKANIRLDPRKLYRIRIRVRRTATATPAQQGFWCGVEGIDRDGVTLENTAGATSAADQHWFAAAAVDAALWTLNEWQIFEGWFQGRAAAGSLIATPLRTAPGRLYQEVGFFRVSYTLNWNDTAGGNVMQIDYITVDEFDEEGPDWGISTEGGAWLSVATAQQSAVPQTGYDDPFAYTGGVIALDVSPLLGSVDDGVHRRFFRVGLTSSNGLLINKTSTGNLRFEIFDGSGGQRTLDLDPSNEFSWAAWDRLLIVAWWDNVIGHMALHCSVNGGEWFTETNISGAGTGILGALGTPLILGANSDGTNDMPCVFHRVSLFKNPAVDPLELARSRPVQRNYWRTAEWLDGRWSAPRRYPKVPLTQHLIPLRLGTA